MIEKLELVEEQGWILHLEKKTENNVRFCLYCGEDVVPPGFYCKKTNRMVHNKCNGVEWKAYCRLDDNHEHFNILSIKWTEAS